MGIERTAFGMRDEHLSPTPLQINDYKAGPSECAITFDLETCFRKTRTEAYMSD